MIFHVPGGSVARLPALYFLSLPERLKGLNVSHDLYVFCPLVTTTDRCRYQGVSVKINKHPKTPPRHLGKLDVFPTYRNRLYFPSHKL